MNGALRRFVGEYGFYGWQLAAEKNPKILNALSYCLAIEMQGLPEHDVRTERILELKDAFDSLEIAPLSEVLSRARTSEPPL